MSMLAPLLKMVAYDSIYHSDIISSMRTFYPYFNSPIDPVIVAINHTQLHFDIVYITEEDFKRR